MAQGQSVRAVLLIAASVAHGYGMGEGQSFNALRSRSRVGVILAASHSIGATVLII